LGYLGLLKLLVIQSEVHQGHHDVKVPHELLAFFIQSLLPISDSQKHVQDLNGQAVSAVGKAAGQTELEEVAFAVNAITVHPIVCLLFLRVEQVLNGNIRVLAIWFHFFVLVWQFIVEVAVARQLLFSDKRSPFLLFKIDAWDIDLNFVLEIIIEASQWALAIASRLFILSRLLRRPQE
jgi:hypothetical protein